MSALPEISIRFCLLLFLMSSPSVDTFSFYTDDDRQQSVPMGKADNRQRDVLHQDILQLMGLSKKPKVRLNEKTVQSASKFMKELYESLTVLDTSSNGPNASSTRGRFHVNSSHIELDSAKLEDSDTIVSLVNNPRKVRFRRHQHGRVFYFDLSEVSVNQRVRSAEIRLYKESSPGPSSRLYTLNLYTIEQSDSEGDKTIRQEARLDVHGSRTGWIIIDAQQCAEHWSLFPMLNMGLYLEVTDEHGHTVDPKDIGIVGTKGPADKQTFFVVYMKAYNERLSRRKRSILNKSDTTFSETTMYPAYSPHAFDSFKSQGKCRRHNFYLDFRKIGFDTQFLIRPEGYSAFFCSGACQYPLHADSNSTNHAIMQILVHTINPGMAPSPCCAPREYGSLALLYFDEKSSVVLKRYKDMIVESCGCQ
ncbi:unnamed protein product [Lymnaea stagnalis]|uniref:TGF-beta family profile domain-containing protein n=1 Tax=Lymnaea stagnalis TaxID=6523 RepID=A0AAV2I4B7_LYMST